MSLTHQGGVGVYLSVHILPGISHKHAIRQQSACLKANQFLIPTFLGCIIADNRLHLEA